MRDLPNPFTESAPLIADRPAAAASSPTSPAAAVTLSSPEVATSAPGMARPEFESRAKATEGNAGMAEATGLVRRSTAGTGLRVGASGAVLTATSELMDVTARRDEQSISRSGACEGNGSNAVGSKTTDGSARTHSGDGLGIHKPGSMTWGGDIVATAPSGRADDSAKCPAVTGSNPDVIDIPAFLQRNPDNTFRFPVTSEA